MVIEQATQILKDYNIFRPDYTYLLHWSTTQTAITAKKVSEALDVSEKTAQKMIDKMEECGLILTGSITKKKRYKMSEIAPVKSDPIQLRFAHYVWSKLKEQYPENKELDKAFVDVWEKDAKLLLVERNNTIEVTETFKFVQQDEFWKTVILSVSNLRSKYDKIRLAMQRCKEEKKENKPQISTSRRYLTDDE